MLITRPLGAYLAWWAFAGRRNSAYIRLGYLQSGLPWPGPLGTLPRAGREGWEVGDPPWEDRCSCPPQGNLSQPELEGRTGPAPAPVETPYKLRKCFPLVHKLGPRRQPFQPPEMVRKSPTPEFYPLVEWYSKYRGESNAKRNLLVCCFSCIRSEIRPFSKAPGFEASLSWMITRDYNSWRLK